MTAEVGLLTRVRLGERALKIVRRCAWLLCGGRNVRTFSSKRTSADLVLLALDQVRERGGELLPVLELAHAVAT